jgi:tetratricopeptide (TPR) repeat protein
MKRHIRCFGTVEKHPIRRFILEKISSFTLSKLRYFFSKGLACGVLRQSHFAKLKIVIFVGTLPLFGAAFNTNDGFINVPIAKQYKSNEIQIGLSTGYNKNASNKNNKDELYEIDYKVAYAINERNQIVFNNTNPSQTIVHFQHTVSDTFSDYQTAIGLRNITESEFSTWNSKKYKEDIQMSPYILNTFYGKNTIFSIGFGIRGFQNDKQTLTGIARYFEKINGLFFGVGYKLKILTIMAEYDGKDLNYGVKIKPNDIYEINVGLTEQMIESDTNPNRNDAPKRAITLGVSIKNIFSHNNHFNNKIRDLNKVIAKYEKREIQRKEDAKKNIKTPLVKKEDRLKAKVTKLYSESLTDYNTRQYDSAIKKLHDANKLSPNNPLILSRLGSVYYTYGLVDHAMTYWKQANDIDPNIIKSPDIKKMLSKY